MGFTGRNLIFQVVWYLSGSILITASNTKPNFVLLLADDLGIGDIGCYGNTTIRTPNIDKLANDGVILTQHLAAAPVCTPSRAAFMTGRYPLRSGMDSCDGARNLKWLGASGGLPHNETTFASILQKQGYSTGLIGTFEFWFLCLTCRPAGLLKIDAPFRAQLKLVTQIMAFAVMTLVIVKYSNMIPINGNVIFYIALFTILFFITWYLKYGFVQYWSCIIMRNHEIIEQPMKVERTSSQIMRETLQFIDRNKNSPFLLIVSFLHVHTPLVTTKAFTGKSKHGPYGDNVEEMDFMVGSVVNAIDNAGLKNNTMIYFASDHGGHLEVQDGIFQTGGWNGIYRGGKGMAGWEGGIRVPGIFRWPGIIPSNAQIDEPTSLMDIYPTVVNLGGGELPNDRVIDGRSLMPLLTKKSPHSEHEFLFHYCGTHLHAVRWHQKESGAIWKAHFVTPNFYPEGSVGCYDIVICACEGDHVTHHNLPLLFDLSADPSESNPLDPHVDPQYKAVLNRIKRAVAEHQETISMVPLQLSFLNNLWKPWLQPCCGTFPFCWCDKEDSNVTEILG
ncbi:arylsulfatase D-like [Engystomops pustulosus]|uniref:arylsulfatase D-like n=1 Tax=Engystomops pustulosus TaxID=76066 RepID=UPI003AFA7B68